MERGQRMVCGRRSVLIRSAGGSRLLHRPAAARVHLPSRITLPPPSARMPGTRLCFLPLPETTTPARAGFRVRLEHIVAVTPATSASSGTEKSPPLEGSSGSGIRAFAPGRSANTALPNFPYDSMPPSCHGRGFRGGDGKKGGLRERVSVRKEKVSGRKEKVSGRKEMVSGRKEMVSGRKEKVSGRKEKVSVRKEKVSVRKEKVSGCAGGGVGEVSPAGVMQGTT